MNDDQKETEGIIGEKRKRTAEEEETKKEGRKQPGASLQGEDQGRDKQTVPNPLDSGNDEGTAPNPLESGTAPNPPECGEDFEVRKHRIGRKPTLPTKADIAEHYPLHLNFRSWCKHCVAGKARATQHKTKDCEEESLGVTLHADYAFMGGDYNEQEDGMQASLVMHDDDKIAFGRQVLTRRGLVTQ